MKKELLLATALASTLGAWLELRKLLRQLSQVIQELVLREENPDSSAH